MNEDDLYAFYLRMKARSENVCGASPAERIGDAVNLGEWQVDRESSLYFDRLWLSEIGIKG